ncbi:NADPH-adrenodoxin reductase [Dipodascopsis tothii]|uniref:NADPH-adrenodoxin reductase n=1 Tax=Dipodascopsis tothii TaxID=44089 RepID=UPI0034CE39B0
MYENLPVPYGLVRYGVAPDHPEVKNCIDTFDKVGQHPRFRFVGNTAVGRRGDNGVPLEAVVRNYDQVVFAYGADSDKKLGVDGEQLHGVYSARQFVGWYNGLPECRGLNPDLSGDEAVVIGQGNVALDVARMLLAPIDHLARTDISRDALQVLAASNVRRVRVVGRRGLAQSAFTNKELRELLALPGVGFAPVAASQLDPLALFAKDLPRALKRMVGLVQKGSAAGPDAPRQWSLEHLLSPARVLARPDAAAVGGVEFVVNELRQDSLAADARAAPTDARRVLPADVVFKSVGYDCTPLDDFEYVTGARFRAGDRLVPNAGGRVLRTDGTPAPGCYVAGWVKRGPTGVIASTMMDAFDTAEAVLADGAAAAPADRGGWPAVHAELARGGSLPWRPVSWADWCAIDAAERAAAVDGADRRKLLSVEAMLDVLA